MRDRRRRIRLGLLLDWLLGVARDDPVGPLDAFRSGLERRIDLAEVNGRLFLNNVSLGLYGDAIQRSGQREAKARTLLEAAEEVLSPSGTAPPLRLTDDLGREHSDVAVVLVSNNPYAFDRPRAAGTRSRLDSGRLGILVIDRPGAPRRPPARAWSAPSLELVAETALPAGIDAEAVDLEPPLRFAAHAGALLVRISSRPPGVSPWADARPSHPRPHRRPIGPERR